MIHGKLIDKVDLDDSEKDLKTRESNGVASYTTHPPTTHINFTLLLSTLSEL